MTIRLDHQPKESHVFSRLSYLPSERPHFHPHRERIGLPLMSIEDYRTRRDRQSKIVERTKLGSILWPKDPDEARRRLAELAGLDLETALALPAEELRLKLRARGEIVQARTIARLMRAGA